MDKVKVKRTIELSQKTKTIKVFFKALEDFVWLDGAGLVLYEFDMEDFLYNECGIAGDDLASLKDLWSVLEFDEEEEIFNEHVGVEGNFNAKWYTKIHIALANHPEEVVEAAIVLGTDIENIGEEYVGKYDSFKAFCEERYRENNEYSIPSDVLNLIDYEQVAVDWAGDYNEYEGHVFNA